MDEKTDISALISLLDDTDQEVYEHVFGKLASLGTGIIPRLEDVWSDTFNPTLSERIEELIHHIQFGNLLNEFRTWKAEGEWDLMEGMMLVSKYQFPELKREEILNSIDDMRRDIWLELNYNLTPIEQINVFNQIFYSHHKFSGNISHGQDPRYYCLNHLLETHKGNSLSLSMLYIILCRKLEIPVYGVDLPRHFILAFHKHTDPDLSNDQELRKNVLFYINPLNKGAIFTRNEIKEYLQQSQLEEKPEYFVPCSNQRVMQVLLNQLIRLYQSSGNPDKANEITQILDLLGLDDSQ